MEKTPLQEAADNYAAVHPESTLQEAFCAGVMYNKRYPNWKLCSEKTPKGSGYYQCVLKDEESGILFHRIAYYLFNRDEWVIHKEVIRNVVAWIEIPTIRELWNKV